MTLSPLLLVYALPLVAIWAIWFWLGRRRTKRAVAVMEEAKIAGLTEPASLHPVIDPALCLGCAACVKACPEKSILGIIDGKAHLIEPSHCVGHGACAAACPTDAISLVFGTETRGIDIPFLSPKYETNVSGLFIAGELGGMGLIRNAIEQGRQAIGFCASKAKSLPGGPGILDVLIVGAGPAGISASLPLAADGARIGDIVEPIGKALARLHRAKGVAITYESARDVAVACDPVDLGEVLSNLMDNACKWARASVRVTWRTEGSTVDITVEDDGPGIPEEARESVFVAGERLDDAVPGTGLGLAIARDIARLYGGDLTLESSPLGGLLARLRIPLKT